MSKRERIPEPGGGKRLAIYCRKSDLKEETKGKSVDQQLEKCRTAAKALGFEVDELLIFTDQDGCKGYWYFQDSEGRNPPPYRKQLTRLVEAVEAGQVDIVMCWRSDRCFRDEIVGALLLRKLRSNGVRFLALTVDYQIHTVTGMDNAMMDAVRNRSYSDRVSADVYRNAETAAKAGEVCKDPSCLGFRSAGLKSRSAVVVEWELALVRRLFDLYVYGPPGGAPMSANAIARLLMDERIRICVGAKGHKSKHPDFIGSGQITAILRNRNYISEQKFDGQHYPCSAFLVPGPNGPETAVARHVFDLAQEMLRSQGQHGRDRRGGLLNGLIVCPDCGRKEYPLSRGSKFERSFYCHNRCGRHRTCWGESYRTIHKCDLEAWVKEHLATLLIAELIAIKAERAGNAEQKELASLEARLSEVRDAEAKKLTELVCVLDAQQMSGVAAEFRRQRETLQSRVTELRTTLREERTRIDDPYDLTAMEEGKLHGALARAVRWIAVTKQGIIVLTRQGAYIGARLGKGKKRPTGGHRPPVILPPDLKATKECLSWIGDRDQFLGGIRRGVGTAHHLPDPDDLLCPEYPELGLVYNRASSLPGSNAAETWEMAACRGLDSGT